MDIDIKNIFLFSMVSAAEILKSNYNRGNSLSLNLFKSIPFSIQTKCEFISRKFDSKYSMFNSQHLFICVSVRCKCLI